MGSNEEIRRLAQEAEKQQLFAQKVQQQNTTLTSQLELYKERVRVLENIKGDNNYLNEFLEADQRAKRYNQQAQSQFITVLLIYFTEDIKEMKDAFEQNDVYLDEIENQNDLLKDQLLEASLTADIKNLVITSCMEIRNKDLHDEIERISKESNDVSFEVTQGLSKRIVELEKDLSKSEAKNAKRKNENLWLHYNSKMLHLKQTYKDLFESVQRSKVETHQCDEAKVKDDFDEIETRNIELEYRVASLIKENEHLKLTYKNLFDSIKKSRVQTKTSNVTQDEKQLDISELNMESGENVCDNAKCEFLTKFVELEKVLTQQTKDFNDVKLELPN
ncbi:hypothetical protein Tco_0666750 [Tanacetum coccineum]